MLPMSLRKALYYPASFFIEAIFGIAAWIVAKSQNVDIVKAANMNKKISKKIVLYAFLIAVSSLCFFGLLTYAYSDLLALLGYESQSAGISIPNFGTYLLFIVISCASPAFFEELLFRGVILSGFSKRTEKFAILFSAFIFTIMHGSADQTVHQFVVGILIGFIFIKTRNYWIGFFVHFFNNFISVTITFLYTIFYKTTEVASATNLSMETTSTSGLEDLFVNDSLKQDLFTWIIELFMAVALAVAGYYIVKFLISKVIAENEKVNGKVNAVALAGSQNINNESENLNNNEFAVNPSDYEIKNEDYSLTGNQEQSQSGDSQNSDGLDNKNVSAGEENDKHSFATVLMFAVSIGYLVFEWILSLVEVSRL